MSFELDPEQEKAAYDLLSALHCEQEPGDLHRDFDTAPGETAVFSYVEFFGKKWDDDYKRWLVEFRFGSSKSHTSKVRNNYRATAKNQSDSAAQHRKDAMDINAYILVVVNREVVTSTAHDAPEKVKYELEQPLADASRHINGQTIRGTFYKCINKKYDLSGLRINRHPKMVSVLAFVICSDTPQLTQSPNRESQSVIYTLKWPREVLEGFEPLLEELGLSSRARVFCYVGSNNTPTYNHRPSRRTSSNNGGIMVGSHLSKKHTDYLDKDIDFTAIIFENTKRMKGAEGKNDTSTFTRFMQGVGFDNLFQSDYVTIVPVSSATSQKDVREAEQAEIDKINGQRGYELLNGAPAATTESAKRRISQQRKQHRKKRKKLEKKRNVSYG